MNISTKGRYAVRALLDLSLNYKGTPILLRDIAKRQEISLAYLEQLISPLIKSGIIVSTRGSKGGIELARSPADIKLIEIITLLEGPILPVECLNNPERCKRFSNCITTDIWAELKDSIINFLEAITLQDLVERQIQKDQSCSTMYYI